MRTMTSTSEQLQAALQAAAEGTGALLRSLEHTAAPIPRSEWTVRETAVHLIVGARLYTDLLTGGSSPVHELSDLRPLNAGAFLGNPETRPQVLADDLAAAAAAFAAAAASVAPEQVMTWHYGLSVPSSHHAAAIVNELLLHGADIARAEGRCPDPDPDAATLAWTILAPWLTVLRFLPAAADGLRRTFALDAAQCASLCFAIADGAITRVEDTAEVDCRIAGTATDLLLWWYHRADWADSGLTAAGAVDLAPTLADPFR